MFSMGPFLEGQEEGGLGCLDGMKLVGQRGVDTRLGIHPFKASHQPTFVYSHQDDDDV